jgi:hypothetical protein
MPTLNDPPNSNSKPLFILNLRRSLFLQVAMLIFFVASARATTFEVGLGNSNNVFPFNSATASGVAAYVGEYQQIYSSTVFSQPFLISSIAFETDPINTIASASYNFTLGLGVTDRTPSNPGSAYSGTFTPVFSGPLTVSYTSGGAFDFAINFATPFTYDPSSGNLIIDIMINSPSSATAVFSAGEDPNLGRVFNFNGNGASTAGPNSGLDTQFTVSSVPDSSSAVFLFGLGLVGLFTVRRAIGLQHRA